MQAKSVSGIGVGSTHLTSKTSTVSKASPTAAISSVHQTRKAKFKYLSRLQERPRLISEVSDTHKSLSMIQIAQSLIKEVLRSVISIEQVIQSGKRDIATLNRVDMAKEHVQKCVNTKCFGAYVLDSSFRPIQREWQHIEFTVQSLDLKREPFSDELVTLHLLNRMVPLMFNRLDARATKLQKFSVMFSLAKLTLRLGDNDELIIGMPDNEWRKWDLNAHVSGNGYRYPQEKPLTFQVSPLVPTIEYITMLDLNGGGALERVNAVIKHLQMVFKEMTMVSTAILDKSNQLTPLCATATQEQVTSIKHDLISNAMKSARVIQRAYIGPSKDNVISLLK
ncbi:hypothetical protein [Vibrio casei]|uniref:Uncharacterized protein n=1 Tax=Vibrio casei TaxID=673372 RepID=A0A368LJ21_9VIBR|nr:hypothetical protein [Vibrio casei]RCS70744.1 hypothetical protein CIK83_15120 [Vibrio casei]